MARKHTYKVGDRVRHDGFGDGTVKYVDHIGNPYAVEFDKSHVELHGCEWGSAHYIRRGHGRWCDEDKLTPIPSARKRDASGRFAGKKKPAKKEQPSLAKRLEALEKKVALNTSAIDVLKSASTLLDCIERDKEKPRAEVTAKELELTPMKEEKWVPKAGDWVVVVTGPWGGEECPYKVGDIAMVERHDSQHPWLPAKGDFTAGVCVGDHHLRPATPEEIAEATKPKPYTPQFGDVVGLYGREWKVVSECEDADGEWLIYKNTDTGWNHDFAKASDLTLIRRP